MVVVKLNSFLGIDFGAYFGLLLRYLLEFCVEVRLMIHTLCIFFVSSVKYFLQMPNILFFQQL